MVYTTVSIRQEFRRSSLNLSKCPNRVLQGFLTCTAMARRGSPAARGDVSPISLRYEAELWTARAAEDLRDGAVGEGSRAYAWEKARACHELLNIPRDHHVLVGADLLYSSRYLPTLVRVSIIYHTVRSLPVCLTRSSPSATEATRIHPSSCPPRGVQLEPQQLRLQILFQLLQRARANDDPVALLGAEQAMVLKPASGHLRERDVELRNLLRELLDDRQNRRREVAHN